MEIGKLKVHLFTLVLNGMPFIQYHINTLKRLTCPWEWHIVEGVAELKQDTSWSLRLGGRITKQLHRDGLSNDGTSEYIDELARLYPEKIYIYRKPKGQFWHGKVEMCNAVIKNIQEECLLWQIDMDEFWTVEQIETAVRLLEQHPEKTACFFYCHYLVGPHLVIVSRDCYGNRTAYEWLRLWRFKPGMFWAKHEPPTLCVQTEQGTRDVAKINPFLHKETEAYNLVFEHYAYVLPKQLLFKEIYFGYKNALGHWKRLQNWETFPAYLRDFFPWVKDEAIVDIFKLRNLDDSILREIEHPVKSMEDHKHFLYILKERLHIFYSKVIWYSWYSWGAVLRKISRLIESTSRRVL